MTLKLSYTGSGFTDDYSTPINRGIGINFTNGNGSDQFYSLADGMGCGDGMGYGDGEGESVGNHNFPFELIKYW